MQLRSWIRRFADFLVQFLNALNGTFGVKHSYSCILSNFQNCFYIVRLKILNDAAVQEWFIGYREGIIEV